MQTFIATFRANIDKLRTDMITRAIQFFTAIAAFLAVGVFQPGLPRILKAFGLIFSVIYILLIGGFQLLPAWLDYRKLRGEAVQAIDEYTVLGPTERKEIKGKLPQGKWNEFSLWFVACTLVYVLELIGFVIALIVLLRKH